MTGWVAGHKPHAKRNLDPEELSLGKVLLHDDVLLQSLEHNFPRVVFNDPPVHELIELRDRE